jgi:uncharacterized protein YyaL (SSP411 family)
MNRLSNAASAYLQSAAHQPVHWFPWSREAFEAAASQDRPVLLDIGAVWCHWCHVMDGESYEDPSLAEFLNQNFVCVKVDRDERPDVDARYQRAVQTFTGQGGWPLTAFLTPAGETFYGGTYFPPDGKYGRPGFRAVLEQILKVYREQRDQVTSQAGAVRRLIAQSLDETGSGQVTPDLLAQAVHDMGQIYDFTNGGFGTAPKFPHPAAVALLLHRWCDQPEQPVREMIELKLLAMASGGIHDHLGGGFHRYSTDARWIVPHFEKMAYDNSELLRAYLDALSVFGREEYRAVALGIVRWVREVLADDAGGYAASQDADVGLDDDGDYFTWTYDEAAAVLSPEELEVTAGYYDIGTAGEMHHNPGKNVLFVSTSLESLAVRIQQPVEVVARLLASAQQKLRTARGQRPSPFIDRTRYTNWNAMVAGALVKAGVTLGDDWARDHGVKTLTRIRAENDEPDAVKHAPGGIGGLLDDQVNVAHAAIELYEVTGSAEWLEWCERIMDRVWREYWDPDRGGLFDTLPSTAGEGLLPTPSKPVQDAPTPSPNGVAGLTFARLYEHTQQQRWRERRDALVSAFAGKAGELGLHGATFLRVVDWQLHPAAHLTIVGPSDDAEAARMHRRAVATFLPRKVVQRLSPGEVGTRSLPPALGAMITAGTGIRAYACVGTNCRMPVSTDQDWTRLLAELRAAGSAVAEPASTKIEEPR